MNQNNSCTVNNDVIKKIFECFNIILFEKKGYIDIILKDSDLKAIYKKQNFINASITSNFKFDYELKEEEIKFKSLEVNKEKFKSLFWNYIINCKTIYIEYQDLSNETEIILKNIKKYSHLLNININLEETILYD